MDTPSAESSCRASTMIDGSGVNDNLKDSPQTREVSRGASPSLNDPKGQQEQGSRNVAQTEDLEVGGSHDFGFLPIPKNLQYNPARPFRFSTVLYITFGFGSTFTVMNLYYCQPLLIQFALAFGVTHNDVSRIPTLVQAGYATGLLLLSPLGDLVRRRPLLLLLVFLSGSLTIGLAATSSLRVFEALSYLVGAFSVTPQVLIPLAADLAPPERRASAISIVLSGLLFGVLLARVLAGVIAEFVTWRVVYYLSIGLQFMILAFFYILLPDWPAKNRGKGVTYFGILTSMAKYTVTEPVLIQSCLMQFSASACFTNFWVTLTFLLGGPPYNYSTLNIGLFGLVGMVGVAMGPLLGRAIDRLIPWYAALIGTLVQLVFQTIQTGAGGIHIAAVVLACIGLDLGRQTQQVAMTTAVYGVSEAARARLNAVLIISIFLGQVTGTAAGTEIFLRFGWRQAAAFSLGLFVWQLVVLAARGPHCERYTWFGWEGGAEPRKWVVEQRERERREGRQDSDRGSEPREDTKTEGEKGTDAEVGVGIGRESIEHRESKSKNAE